MRILCQSLLLLLVSACGGGGAAATVAAPPAEVAADIAVTVENALDVTRAGVRGAFDLQRLVYLGVSLLRAEKPETPAGNAPGTVSSREHVGPAGGTATFAWDDVDGGGAYTSPDVFTIDFDGYVSGALTLDGVMVVRGAIQGSLPSAGAWIVDGVARMLGLDVAVGAQTVTFDTELPFHFENRIIVELFELELAEDFAFGDYVIQRGASFLRYATSDVIRFSNNGAVYSAPLDATVRFEMPEFITADYFSPDPFLGKWYVCGTGDSLVEVEPFCLIPLSSFCTTLDLRVDEDGDENFEATLSAGWSELLPQ